MSIFTKKPADNSLNPYSRSLLYDLIFLTSVTLALHAYFITGLGFYSDDWLFLGILSNSDDQSFTGLVQTFFREEPLVRARPVQVIQIAALYWLFEMKPLGYHLANTFVLVATTALFYSSLKQINLPRYIAVGTPLIYALLPHYSTTHLWIATFCTNVSMAFFFLNFYSNLRYISPDTSNKRFWLSVSAISLAASILAYETAAPLFVLTILATYYQARKNQSSASGISKILLITNLILFCACLLFKTLVSERTGGFVESYTSYIFHTTKSVLVNDYLTYGARLYKIIHKVVTVYYNGNILLVTAIVYVSIFIYMMLITKITYHVKIWAIFIAVGIIVYFAGYAAFLASAQIQISPTGLSNRVTMAAAVGIAICFIGAIGFVCSFIPSQRLSQVLFALAVSSICACGYAINCTVASFFSSSYQAQLAILDSLYATIPVPKPGSTLILDGVCPYNGPAPVFECYWDIRGALQVHYRNQNIKADVRAAKLIYNEDGLTTTIYGENKFYPFSKNLIIYNNNTNKYYILHSSKAADLYFSSAAADMSSCPRGQEGYGATIF